MQTAGIYARVSSDRQKEEQTIESQIESLIEYAQEKGYLIPDEWIFQDEGYSGTTLVRPALERMRDLVSEGQIETVLLYSPDRLSRKYAYQVLLTEEFSRHGAEVIFIKSPKATTPEEQLLLQFQGMIAEYERAQIIERTRRGKKHRAKTGSIKIVEAKGDKERIVPISAETHELIWQYHASRPVPKPKYQDFVFLNRRGRLLNKDIIGKMFRRLGRRAGVQVNAHKFRHTGATEFVRNGGDPFALQKILGHSTMPMVERYIHLAKVDIEQAHRRASPVYNWDLRT